MRASYNQAEYLDERRAMMQQWADIENGYLALDEDDDSDLDELRGHSIT